MFIQWLGWGRLRRAQGATQAGNATANRSCTWPSIAAPSWWTPPLRRAADRCSSSNCQSDPPSGEATTPPGLLAVVQGEVTTCPATGRLSSTRGAPAELGETWRRRAVWVRTGLRSQEEASISTRLSDNRKPSCVYSAGWVRGRECAGGGVLVFRLNSSRENTVIREQVRLVRAP